jgi:hypothetical protein
MQAGLPPQHDQHRASGVAAAAKSSPLVESPDLDVLQNLQGLGAYTVFKICHNLTVNSCNSMLQ